MFLYEYFRTPSLPPPAAAVFVVAAEAELALHWRSEALCLICSRQTDLWGFIDSKLHRGRHRAGSMEAVGEARGVGGRFVGREAGRGGRRFGWGDRHRQTKSGGTDNERE